MSGAAKAPLVEVFWSIQGEGRFVGEPMAFVRVATCPIRCRYCDTQHSYVAAKELAVQAPAGLRREPNPVTAARARELVNEVLPAPVRTGGVRVSVTGGEPLVVPSFVRELGERLRDDGARLHLETAALDPAALAHCVGVVAHLSADWKLPSTLHGGADHGDAHLRCCDLALGAGATVDVKLVLTEGVGDAEFAAALQRLHPLRDDVLLVLQPVTPTPDEPRALPPARLQHLLETALAMGFAPRVLPQVHKQLAVP